MSIFNRTGHDIKLNTNHPGPARQMQSPASAVDPSSAFSQLSLDDGAPLAQPPRLEDPIARSKSSMSMRSYQSIQPPQQHQPRFPPQAPLGGYYPPHQQQQHAQDPYFAAANNVLGVGPPPPPPQAPPPSYEGSIRGGYEPSLRGGYEPSLRGGYEPSLGGGYEPSVRGGYEPSINGGYEGSVGYDPSIYDDYSSSASHSQHPQQQHSQQQQYPPSEHHPQQQQQQQYPPGGGYYPTNHSQTSFQSLPPHPGPPDTDFDMRPTLGPRLDSVRPSTTKSKAVDLSTPPYTKEYIDSYRQRIKADPDPEAHFLYAKYLIDAARKIRQTAKDSKAGKRYSEALITEALKVIRRLATQGQNGEVYPEAQFYLANCFGSGALGLQVDHERAYHLYLQAAKQNHAPAAYRVGVCNEIGAGTRRDWSRASAFYRKAASLGDTAAMYKLGVVLMNGALGEERRERDAAGWLKRAAEQADEENPHALHELGLLYESGPGISPTMREYIPPDPYQAKALFTQAAHLGYTPSQYKLGQCYEYGTVACPVDPRRSIAWYTKAAEKGDAEAELALSGWYLTGSEGVLKQSDSEAYLWARRAANKGLSKAEYAVGYYAEVGIGVKQDMEFAKRWYMRAAAQGNKRAMNRLTEMKRMGNQRPGGGGGGGAGGRPTRQQAKDECVIC
ncbi:hypothetical protein PQX77_019766 [Marasmius sp. AFHP31]|nr:hypothetical protein PQX77_019766 [Marasmius sp. AFHP31]